MRKMFFFLLLTCMLVLSGFKVAAQSVYTYQEEFENGIPATWTQEYVSGNQAWSTETDGTYPLGTKDGSAARAYLRNNTTQTIGYKTKLVTPELNLSTVLQPILVFDHAQQQRTGDVDTLRIYYRTSPNDAWTFLKEYDNKIATWVTDTIELPGTAGTTTYQVAFEGSDNMGRGIVIDNVRFRPMPMCEAPYNITTSQLGVNYAELSWAGSLDADSFIVVITNKAVADVATLDAFTPSTLDSTVLYFKSVSDFTFATDSTLEQNTRYYAYIKSFCGLDESEWSGVSFSTLNLSGLPFVANFDLEYQAGTVYMARSWTSGSNVLNSTGTSYIVPYINTATSSSSWGYYSPDTTTSLFFNKAYYSALGSSYGIEPGYYMYTATPQLDVTTLRGANVSFWLTAYSAVTTGYSSTSKQMAAGIIVGVMTDPNDWATFQAIDTCYVTYYQKAHFNVSLANYRGQGKYVAFASNFSDRYNSVSLDKVVISKPATPIAVPTISNITATGFNINAGVDADSYNIIVAGDTLKVNSPVGVAPAARSVIWQSTLPARSITVNPGKSISGKWVNVYVQAVSGGVAGEWSEPVRVRIPYEASVPTSFTTEGYSITDGNAYNYPATGNRIWSTSTSYPVPDSLNAASHYTYMPNSTTSGLCMYYCNEMSFFSLPYVADRSKLLVSFTERVSSTSYTGNCKLQVGMVKEPTDYNSFEVIEEIIPSYAASAAAAKKHTISIAKYTGSNRYVAFRAVPQDSYDGSFAYIYLNAFELDTIAACMAASSVKLDSISDVYASASWEGWLNDEWEVILSTSAKFSDTVSVQTVQATNAAFTNLLPNTKYYFKVKTLCADTALWSAVEEFTTDCPSSYTLPYSENFDNYLGYSSSTYGYEGAPCGWTMPQDQYSTYTYGYYPYISSYATYAYSGNYLALQCYYSASYMRSDSTLHFALPQFADSVSRTELSFMARAYSTSSSYTGKLMIGVFTNPNSLASFVPYDTLDILSDLSTTWKKYTVSFEDYAGAEGAIGMVLKQGNVYSRVYLDDIRVKRLTNCPKILSVNADNIGLASADLSWTSNGSDFLVYVADTIKSQAQLNAVAGSATAVTDTFCTVSGLNGGTTYYAYVKAPCTEDETEWIGPCIFRTVQGVPYYDSLTVVTNVTRYSQLIDPVFAGTASLTTTTTSGWHVFTEEDGMEETHMAVNNYGASSHYWLVTPVVSLENTSVATLSFKLALTDYNDASSVDAGGTDDRFIVVVSDDAGKTWKKQNAVIWNNTGDGDFVYDDIPVTAEVVYIDLADYLGKKIQVGFYCESTVSNADNNIHLGQVSISQDQHCFTPVKLSVPAATLNYTSAQVTWSAGSASAWNLKYAPVPAQAGDTVVVNGLTSPSYTITGLTAHKKYVVSVQAACGAGNGSDWATISFLTPCDAVTPVAYATEGFADASSLDCWTLGVQSGTVNTPSYNSNHGGSLYFYNDANSDGAYAIMPPFILDSINHYTVTFNACSGSTLTTNTGKIVVGVLTDPADLSTIVPVKTLAPSYSAANIAGDAMDEFTVSFAEYLGDYNDDFGKYIIFYTESGEGTDYIYVDNVRVDSISKCTRPYDLAVDALDTVATVTWAGQPDVYQLLLSKKAIDIVAAKDSALLADSTLVWYTVADSSYVLKGLTPNTNYYLYVRGICDSVPAYDYTAWGKGTSFHTECVAIDLPYSENFTNYATGTTSGTTFIDCWTRFTKGSASYNYVYVAGSGNGDSRSLYFYNSTSYNVYAVMPRAKFDIADAFMTFDMKSSSTMYQTGVLVAVASDITNADSIEANMTVVDTIYANGTAWQKQEVMFNKYAAYDGEFIVIKALPIASFYTYVDNISIIQTPSCLLPNKVEISNIASKSAVASWNNRQQGATQWEYAVVKAGVKIDSTTVIYTANATTAKLAGLTPGTSYDFYVRVKCSATEESEWTPYTRFATAYGMPYSEPLSTATAWSRYSYLASNILDGKGKLTATTTSGWVVATNTYGVGYTPHMKNNVYGTSKYNWLVSPAIYLDSVSNIKLEFDLAFTKYASAAAAYLTGDDDRFIVFVSEDGGATWPSANAVIWNNAGTGTYVYNNIATTGERIQLSLDQYKGKQVAIAFYVESTVSNADNDIHVGKVEIYKESSCQPTASVAVVDTTVTAYGATLKWNSQADASWEVVAIADGDTAYVGYTTDTVLAVTGLTPATDYTVYVSNVCDDTIYSKSVSVELSTLCAVYPFTAASWNFNSSLVKLGTLDRPKCWDVTNIATTSAYGGTSAYVPYVPAASTVYDYGRNGTGALRFYNYSTYAKNATAALPEIDFQGADLDTVFLHFWARNCYFYSANYSTASSQSKLAVTNNNYGKTLLIGVMTDPEDASTFVALDSVEYSNSWSSTTNVYATNDPNEYWEEYKVSMSSFKGKTGRIAFQLKREGTSTDYFFIDDVDFITGQVCFPVKATLTDVTSTGASFEWADKGSFYEYKLSNTSNQVVSTGLTQDTTLTLTGLTPSSTYTLALRTVCDTATAFMADWTNTQFGTCLAAPYTTDMTGGKLPSGWNGYSDLMSSVLNGGNFKTLSSTWSAVLATDARGMSYDHVKANVYSTYTRSIVSPEIYVDSLPYIHFEFDAAVTAYNKATASTTAYPDDRMLVLVSEDAGKTWLPKNATIWSANDAQKYTDIPAAGERYYVDLSKYQGKIIKIAVVGESTVGNADNDLHLGGFSIVNSKVCFAPEVTLVASTDTTATFSWSDPDAIGFKVTYNGATVNQTDTFYTIRGLNYNTTYTVAVQSQCDSVNLSKQGFGSYTTPKCAPLTGGSFEWNFDNNTTDVDKVSTSATYKIPSCWVSGNEGSTSDSYRPHIYPTGTSKIPNAKDDSIYCLKMYGYGSYRRPYVVLPRLACDLDTMQLSFWARNGYQNSTTEYIDYANVGYTTYAAYGRTLIIGTTNDPTSIADMDTLGTFTSKTHSTALAFAKRQEGWEKVNIPLEGATGEYIVIVLDAAGTSTDYMFLDNIKVFNSNCAMPSSISAAYAGNKQAELTWNGSSAGYNVLIKSGKDTVYNNEVDTTALTFPVAYGKTYDIAIYGVCEGSNSEVSTSKFTMPYGVPYLEDFAASTFPTSYTQSAATISSVLDKNVAPTITTGGYSVVTTGNGLSGNHVKANVYSTYTRWLITPEILIDSMPNLYLSFDAAVTAYANGTKPSSAYPDDRLVVMVSTDAGQTWTSANAYEWSETSALGRYQDIPNTGATYYIDFSKYQGKTVKIAFAGESTVSNADNDLHFDNIAISQLSCAPMLSASYTCPSANNFKITWNSAADQVQVQIATAKSFADSQIVVDSIVTAETYSFSSQEPGETFYYRVRSYCSATEQSKWVSGNFSTDYAIRFYEGFGQNGTLPTGWKSYIDEFAATGATTLTTEPNYSGTYANSYWRPLPSNYYGIAGSAHMVVRPNGSTYTAAYNTYNQWLVSPVINIDAEDSVKLSFIAALTAYDSKLAPTLTSDNAEFAVVVSTDQGATWSRDNAIFWNESDGEYRFSDISATGQRYILDLSKYAGERVKVAFFASYDEGTYSAPEFTLHIDDVQINRYVGSHTDAQVCQYEDYEDANYYIDEARMGVGENDFYTYVASAVDSVADTYNTLTVNMVTATTTTYNVDVCKGETYNNFGFDFVAEFSGVHKQKLQGTNTCDSIVVLNVNVLSSSVVAEYDTICLGSSFTTATGKVLTMTGVYPDTLSSVVTGCDSIILYNLAVLDAGEVYDTLHLCPGDTYEFYGQTITKAGEYRATITNQNGCEAYLYLFVIYETVKESTTNVLLCQGSSYTDENFPSAITIEGDYKASLKSQYGCDSIVNLHVLVENNGRAEDFVNVNSLPYVLNGQTILPLGTPEGKYTRVVSTDCGEITLTLTVGRQTALDNVNTAELVIAPNPASVGEETQVLNSFAANQTLSLEVYNVSGALVYTNIVTSTTGAITIPGMATAGVYMVRISDENVTYQAKLVVK